MPDIFDKNKRSEIMRKISRENTKPEIIIRKILYSFGYRYRLHRKDLPGTPDINFISKKKVIFINGCFWHGHNCKRGTLPKSNIEFWKNKINKNIERDKQNYNKLCNMKWKYLVIWQCEIKKKNMDKLITKLINFLDNDL